MPICKLEGVVSTRYPKGCKRKNQLIIALVSVIIRGVIIQYADLKEGIFLGRREDVNSWAYFIGTSILMRNIRKPNIWKIVGKTVDVFIREVKQTC